MTSTMQTEFSRVLKRLLDKSGKTQYQLAKDSEVDEAYVFRLVNGERRKPSRDMVIKLGMGLMRGAYSLDINDVNALLMSAEYMPLRGRGERLPAWS